MKILKETLLDVNHSRKGSFKGIALRDFDTEDEWYPIAIATTKEGGDSNTVVEGLNTYWVAGDETPCRKSLCAIEVVK